MFGISFLNPAFLFGALAGLIPILIHLLNRRRVPKIHFSHLEFLWQVNRQRMSRLNLQRLLLLLLRVLAILILAFAFARPTLRGSLAGLLKTGARSSVCLLLDTSFSMRVETERGNLFDEARARTQELLQGLSPGDEVSVVLFSDEPKLLFAEPTRDLALVERSLDEVEAGYGGTDLKRAMVEAYEILAESGRANREIYIISDLQEPAFSGEAILSWEEEDGHEPAILFMPVIPGDLENVSIDKVTLPITLVRPGETAKISALLTNHGKSEATFPLQLIVDGEVRGEVEVNLSPEGNAVHDFFVTVPRSGLLRGEMKKRFDRLEIDDRRYFLLPVADQVHALVVGDERGLEAFYLSRALNPAGSGAGDIRVTSKPAELVTTADLNDVDVVLTPDPLGLSQAQLDELFAFAERGGGLVFFLPRPDEVAAYNRGLFSHMEELILLEPRKLGESFVTLTDLREAHPFFAPFREDELAGLLSARFYRFGLIERRPPGPPLARFSDGSPAIVETSAGRGTVVVLAFPLDLESDNFPLAPMFLPLMHQMVYTLSPGGEADRPEDGRVGDRVSWTLGSGWSGGESDLICLTPQGVQVLPRFDVEGKTFVSWIDETESPGFYTLNQDTVKVGEVAVNLDPGESATQYMNHKDAAKLLGVEGADAIDTGASLAAFVEENRQGREIFSLVILIVLLLLFAELLLGRGKEHRAVSNP